MAESVKDKIVPRKKFQNRPPCSCSSVVLAALGVGGVLSVEIPQHLRNHRRCADRRAHQCRQRANQRERD